MQLLTEEQVSMKRPFDRLAVASAALSLLWIYGLGSLLGAVLGVMALHRLPADPSLATRRGRGLAAFGLVLGIVGFVATAIALVVLLRAASDLDYPM